MREVYLTNRADSVVTIPLFEKTPVKNYLGRSVLQTNFVSLKPGQKYSLGESISKEAREFYSGLKGSLVFVETRVLDNPVEDSIKEEVSSLKDETSEESPEVVVEEEFVQEVDLKSLTKDELVKIAISLGIDKAKNYPKGLLISRIKEKKNAD